ncbi:MAG: hypothetical protein OEU26_24580, partial [Candidatus Tectomicrobia bacterium]|nr:hypothetical protein [Candidatus Tectomicrobia bacterium]
GEVGVLGDETDDVQLMAVSAQQTADDINRAWINIGVAVTSPLVTAWNTTALSDGKYELRAVCAADASVVATFQTNAEAGGGSSGCFIATATYGSPLHTRVQTLRDFRDAYLLTHTAGRWAVAQYYRLSPPLANTIRHRPWLRAVVRVGLTPVVWAVSLTSQQAASLLGAFALLLVAVGLRLRHNQTVEHRL